MIPQIIHDWMQCDPDNRSVVARWVDGIGFEARALINGMSSDYLVGQGDTPEAAMSELADNISDELADGLARLTADRHTGGEAATGNKQWNSKETTHSKT